MLLALALAWALIATFVDDEQSAGPETGITLSRLAQSEPDSVDGDIRRGERVTVTGTIRRIDRIQAADLSRLLATGGHPELAAAPTNLGDVFVAADDVDA